MGGGAEKTEGDEEGRLSSDGRAEDVAENQRVPVCRGMKGTASGLAGMWSEDTASTVSWPARVCRCMCVERGEKLERKKKQSCV